MTVDSIDALIIFQLTCAMLYLLTSCVCDTNTFYQFHTFIDELHFYVGSMLR